MISTLPNMGGVQNEHVKNKLTGTLFGGTVSMDIGLALIGSGMYGMKSYIIQRLHTLVRQLRPSRLRVIKGYARLNCLIRKGSTYIEVLKE
jgi:hypothetical protein